MTASSSSLTTFRLKKGGLVNCLLGQEKEGLAITATDGQEAFYIFLKKSAIQSSKLKHVKFDEDAWHDLFCKLVSQNSVEGKTLEVSVDKEGIKLVILDTSSSDRLKMALVTIPRTEEVEIDLQNWLAQATDKLVEQQKQVAASEVALQEFQRQLAECRKQNEDQRVEFKESTLQRLHCMNALLNQKKDKIRELQGLPKLKRPKVEQDDADVKMMDAAPRIEEAEADRDRETDMTDDGGDETTDGGRSD